MSWISIFGNENNTRKSHIKNLIAVAMADGHLAQEEWAYLVKVAQGLDMTHEEIQNIKNNPDDIKFKAPKKYEDKLQQVEDLVTIMTIDNDINRNEMELCKKIALNLDLLPRVINDLVNTTYNKIK